MLHSATPILLHEYADVHLCSHPQQVWIYGMGSISPGLVREFLHWCPLAEQLASGAAFYLPSGVFCKQQHQPKFWSDLGDSVKWIEVKTRWITYFIPSRPIFPYLNEFLIKLPRLLVDSVPIELCSIDGYVWSQRHDWISFKHTACQLKYM